MTIIERMRRDNTDDKIYLGDLVEKMFAGEAGTLFKALLNDIRTKTLEVSKREGARLPADRYLGRIEAMDDLSEYIIRMVENKRALLAEQKEASRV